MQDNSIHLLHQVKANVQEHHSNLGPPRINFTRFWGRVPYRKAPRKQGFEPLYWKT